MQTLNIESDAVEEVLLSQIRLDEETQIRATINAETVQKYYDVMETEEGRNGFPPILLFRDDKGILWLADGHHRVLAAIRRKLTSIRAIIKNGSKREALWAAAKANRHNGLQMGKLDIRRAVKKILVFFPDRSNRVIAETVGCSYEYVRKIRETTDNLLSVERTIGKDGKSRPARQQNKTVAPQNEVITPQKTQTPPPSSVVLSDDEAAANDTSEKPTDTKVDQAKPESQLTERQQKLRDLYPDMNLKDIIEDLLTVHTSTSEACSDDATIKVLETIKAVNEAQGMYDASEEAEIASIWKDVKINQTYNCGVEFKPDPDDDYFDWITDEHREELRKMQATSPNRLVPRIRNYTIQCIPEHNPEYLLGCLFSLFGVIYRKKLFLGLGRKMFRQDGNDLTRELVTELHDELTGN